MKNRLSNSFNCSPRHSARFLVKKSAKRGPKYQKTFERWCRWMEETALKSGVGRLGPDGGASFLNSNFNFNDEFAALRTLPMMNLCQRLGITARRIEAAFESSETVDWTVRLESGVYGLILLATRGYAHEGVIVFSVNQIETTEFLILPEWRE